jgi:DNA-binding transcriptional regulator WhiA
LSYSQAIRTSLAAQDPAAECCRSALLGGLSAVAGHLRPDGFMLEVETAAVARQAFRLWKLRPGSAPHLVSGGHRYRVVLDGQLPGGDPGLYRKTCCRRTWLRGAFLAGGSLTRPGHGYHLEFTGPDAVMSGVQTLLSREGIKTGRDERRVYVKAAEDIVAFLAVVGAIAERLAYEQVLLGRDLKNRVQRTVNCETANLSRTVEAAQRQVAQIEELIGSGALDRLPAEIQATAWLRVANPYATLSDLAALHDPPISKSAVNHRIRAITQAGQRR